MTPLFRTFAAASVVGVAVVATLDPAPASASSIFDFGIMNATAQGLEAGGHGYKSLNLSHGNEAGRAAVSGSLRDGKLHATASSNPDGISACPPYDYYCYWAAEGSIGMFDRVTFSADDASRLGGVLKYSFDFDGTYDRGKWWGGGGGYGSWYVGTSYLAGGYAASTWLDPKHPVHYEGEIAIEDGTSVYMEMGLGVSAQDGATVDFGNTGKFNWVVPEGFHYTSASGEFMADVTPGAMVSAAPEPAAWTMLILGFGLSGAVMRRRRMSNLAAIGA